MKKELSLALAFGLFMFLVSTCHADELETQYMHVLNRRNDDQYLTAKKPLKRKW